MGVDRTVTCAMAPENEIKDNWVEAAPVIAQKLKCSWNSSLTGWCLEGEQGYIMKTR